MRRIPWFVHTLVLAGAALIACSGNKNSFSNGTDPTDPSNPTGPGTFTGDGGSGDGGPIAVCSPDPKNFDIPGNGCDDDGDGKVDNPPTCDTTATGNTADDFAKAIGLCDSASSAKGYGLVSATFTQGYNRTDAPHDEQHGILPKFGDVIKPREGSMLGVLSTGYAQEYDGTGTASFGGATGNGNNLKLNGVDWNFANPIFGNGTPPPGFPKAAKGCLQTPNVNDVVDVKLTIKAPPNVSGIKFDFNFYSGEWPAYVCTPFNDGFIAYLSAKGFNSGAPDNMSFDKDGNPVSVNNGFFDRCTPSVPIGCAGTGPTTSACPGGPAELAGTGFGASGEWCKPFAGSGTTSSTNGGATGWLTSQAPVNPGETFTIEFMIWDAGDGLLDSSVLVDNFTWAAGAVTPSTDRPH